MFRMVHRLSRLIFIAGISGIKFESSSAEHIVISLPDASTGAKETVLSQIFVVNQSIFFASGLNCYF